MIRKNVAIVIRDLKSNGAERVAITLAEGFMEIGLNPFIICFKKDIQLPINKGVSVLIFSEKFFRWIPRRIRGILTAPFLDLFIKIKIGTPSLILSNLTVSVKVEKNIIGIRGTLEKKKLNFIASVTKSSEQLINFLKLTIVGVYEIITGTRGTDE